MKQPLKRYRVRATMYQGLTCVVEAMTEEHAISLAKRLADNGSLTEGRHDAGITDYSATEEVS